MVIAKREIESVVLFGGAGLVGKQIARKLCREHAPRQIVICALFEHECIEVVNKLKQEFPNIEDITYEYGNIFVRKGYAHTDRRDISADSKIVSDLFDDVFDKSKVESEEDENYMGYIIKKYRPDAVVDCVNTATGISYQDVKSSSAVVKQYKDELFKLISSCSLEDVEAAKQGDSTAQSKIFDFAQGILTASTAPLETDASLNKLNMLDLLLVSQAVPQLVRHVVLLQKALLAAGTKIYLKIGTTGTGGMGLNIPYTHGEDRPSFTLMAKTSVGFAHTGLLFLLARSPGPIVKEIKPGAMIGYRKIDFRPIRKFRKPIKRWETKQQVLADSLILHDKEDSYSADGDLKLVGIDTGENGFFTKDEFEAISYLNQMEFVTPEEIATLVIREINGANTGKDVISAIDGAVLDPSYRAGYIRQNALDELEELEQTKGIPSVAIGELGPPQLSKFLYETHLLKQFYRKVADLAAANADELAKQLEEYVLENKDLQQLITSLGLPILLSDGKTILRGPTIHIPESKVHASIKIESESDIDSWAKQGWIDLRSVNMQVWIERAQKMQQSVSGDYIEGSSVYARHIYTSKYIKTGEVVGWIFINELNGGRIF